MRKIKRFVLNDGFTVLSAEAQKNVFGGYYSSANSCGNASTQSQCSGTCVNSYNQTGSCSWGKVNKYSSTYVCRCATATML